ncbi:MAG TPA: hypothetical protein VK466_09540 [Terriglobales bacterium]|nr:hypothetical protein [Terriglobales bacterium]
MGLGLLLGVALLPTGCAVEKNYANGKVVVLEQRTRDRVKMYIANTPIMSEDPYWTLTIEVNGTRYVGEFLPEANQRELSAGTWKSNDEVQVRLEKKVFYVRRDQGSDAKLVITRKTRISS